MLLPVNPEGDSYEVIISTFGEYIQFILIETVMLIQVHLMRDCYYQLILRETVIKWIL